MKEGLQSKQHLRQKYLHVRGKEREQMKEHTEIRVHSDGEDVKVGEIGVLLIILCSLQQQT